MLFKKILLSLAIVSSYTCVHAQYVSQSSCPTTAPWDKVLGAITHINELPTNTGGKIKVVVNNLRRLKNNIDFCAHVVISVTKGNAVDKIVEGDYPIKYGSGLDLDFDEGRVTPNTNSNLKAVHATVEIGESPDQYTNHVLGLTLSFVDTKPSKMVTLYKYF